MPDIQFLIDNFGRRGIIALVVIAAFLSFDTILRAWTNRRTDKGRINERLRVQSGEANTRAAYVELMRRRGLTSSGQFQLHLIGFNRLVMQSGISLPIVNLLLIMAIGTIGAAGAVFTLTADEVLALLGGLGVGIVAPLALLFMLRARRRAKLEAQLPEAVDVMVRSLRAGHPLQVAIGLVAREMPDPIGSEFGLVSDEMTYGLDLETAMNNLRARAGQSDLSFLVVAVSIQSKTGGNLAEILGNLSQMVRDRARMRRKVHSLSAEGRFSAVGLSLIPCVIFLAISAMTPSYYGDVRGDPMFIPAVYFALFVWAIGVITMYRMVNFKI